MNTALVTEILTVANATPFTPARASGCGRAYVCIAMDKATIKTVAAACKALNLLFIRKNYGAGDNAIYIGYDNADGRALGKAEAFAAVLNSRGIKCYTDAGSD